MAAGVSIVVCLLLQIMCLTVSSASIKEADVRYLVLGSNDADDPQLMVDDVHVQAHSLSRVRREDVVPEYTSPTSVTTSSTPTEVNVEEETSATTDILTLSSTPAAVTTPSARETTPEETTHVQITDKYYRWTAMQDNTRNNYWIPEEVLDAEGKQTHGTLSDSHRTAGTIRLSFPFLFYGHTVQQVTVATGGFIYVSDFVHQWLTATQYVAPLMANFDTTLGNNSYIHYRDNGTAFTVWWENLHLQDQKEEGTFNFQATLHSDGTIVFAYKHIALTIDQLSTRKHPVKIGLSDAYYIDKRVKSSGRYHTRRTIYEYNQVVIDKSVVRSNAVIIVSPNPTCITLSNCSECMSAQIDFTCRWCHNLQQCSDGYNRHRQEWLKRGCDKKKTYPEDHCIVSLNHDFISVGAIVAIIVLLSVVFLLVAWLLYAYKNPQSKSGIWLIEHRPSQLKARLSNVRFWKHSDTGDKYQVTMQPDGESVA